jgi:hypothetical protein
LIPKARQAIERYGHQIVVGNLLATRKSEVVFVWRDGYGRFAGGEREGQFVAVSAGEVQATAHGSPRYGHQIVVGNLLATRKSEVVFVTKESEMWLRVPYDGSQEAREKVSLSR